jgi:hypothetical protein
MRFIAWNVNHRTRVKSIAPGFARGLASLQPDAIVLTEYVPGVDHERLCAQLGALGFTYMHMSHLSPGHNQVLIGTRTPSTRGTLRLGEPAPNADSNFLHVHLEQEELELVGFRVPAYSDVDSRRKYWKRFAKQVGPLVDSRIVLTGDFNTHLARNRCVGAQELRRLRDAGWQVITPAGGSYCGSKGNTTPIDHALVGRQLYVGEAVYVAEHGTFRFGGRAEHAMSDHAILAFEVAVDRAMRSTPMQS